jgi:uncharacterized lipoprotein YddW (UPF0748 family)
MNRRVFIHSFGLQSIGFLSLCSLLNTLGCTSPRVRTSKNWIWVPPDRRADDDDWKRRFEKFKNAGIDAVLPEVYRGRPAYYGSSRFPVQAEFLEQIIPIARSFQLEIHTWMWTMPCMLEDIQKNHPDWYNVNRLGESSVEKPAYVTYYKFLCPAKEEVHEFIQDTVRELAQYDVDGVHLDYVRYPDVILPKGLWKKYDLVQDKEYPQFDYCYCHTCREKFKNQEGIDPLEIEDPSTHEAWIQFRHDQVTNMVNNVLIPTAHKYDKIMSAAVFPNWENVRQEWYSWKLDAVLPMLYNRMYQADAEWIKQQCVKGIKSLKHDTQLYSGLMLDKPDKFKDYVIKSFEGGAKGISIFSSRRLRDEHLDILERVLI